MSSWAGFSDEELRKIQQKECVMPAAAARGRKPALANRSRQQFQRERALQLAVQKNPSATSLGLPPEQQLNRSLSKEKPGPQLVVPTGPPPVREEIKMTENHQSAPEETTLAIKELEKQEVELLERTRLEQLQQEQKMIEEKNKRKKALLVKTIAEKSKQTQAETVKLKRIQRELQALDDMVSNDIGILRDRIEQASWNYNAASKRYEKAEAEYVTAKLDLHKKTEVKEQLTEHLYAIIQQNELRKAQKLEELMQQLQLQATEEESETSGVEQQRDASAENREAPVESAKDCGRPEETMKEEDGEGRRDDVQPPAETQQETLENCVQSGAVTS